MASVFYVAKYGNNLSEKLDSFSIPWSSCSGYYVDDPIHFYNQSYNSIVSLSIVFDNVIGENSYHPYIDFKIKYDDRTLLVNKIEIYEYGTTNEKNEDLAPAEEIPE